MPLTFFFLASIFFIGITPNSTALTNPFAAWTRWNLENISIFSHAIKAMAQPPMAQTLTAQDTLAVCSFDDIGGTIPDDIKEIVALINNSKNYSNLGIELPKGILLYGPPGTGKTSLARAIAGETHAAFFAKSAADFVELYLGNGPKQVRELFAHARKIIRSGEFSRVIIFIDELDSIGSARQYGGDREYHNTLNELLNQMDSFFPDLPIIVIGATNRIDDLDKALLRPGRFDRLIEVPLPDVINRQAIIEHYARRLKLKVPDRLFPALAKKTTGYNGAELKNLVQEAVLFTARENAQEVTETHFALALKKTIEQKKIRS